MPAPKTKAEFTRLMFEGRCGNSLRTWKNWQEWQKDDYRGSVTIRCLVPGSSLCRYRVESEDVPLTILSMAAGRGLKDTDFIINESAPDERLTMQGELQRGPSGVWQLYYSTAQMPMRLALAKRGQYAEGIRALEIVRYYANGNSYDMLKRLIDEFDTETPHGECVIEFSCYDFNLGIEPFHNTVVWELRGY